MNTNSFPHLEAAVCGVLELCCHSGVQFHLADWVTTQQGALNHLSWGLMAWPGWSPHDVTAKRSQEGRRVGALVWVAAILWVCAHLNKCMSTWSKTMCVCVRARVRPCVCVRLLPSAPSNRLIFHISHGQEGQEAARLRPEPGYSSVSSARHSLAPPKLSALLPNALARANMHWLGAPCSHHPRKGLHHALAPLSRSWGLQSWLGPPQLCYSSAKWHNRKPDSSARVHRTL